MERLLAGFFLSHLRQSSFSLAYSSSTSASPDSDPTPAYFHSPHLVLLSFLHRAEKFTGSIFISCSPTYHLGRGWNDPAQCTLSGSSHISSRDWFLRNPSDRGFTILFDPTILNDRIPSGPLSRITRSCRRGSSLRE